MSNPHHTTPFRRPTGTWGSDVAHDAADMGIEFGLEMSLGAHAPTHGEVMGDELVARMPAKARDSDRR
jgi:hypothetical protein